ncbi:MAG: sulfurtransferase TusA family protein [Euryarchaeota archaeon]|jgi:tRNA 2-thiouridine synthesizing protein A|nr:sulfurtransferase TusA family protein [Euryarchaeota archaeon]MBT3653913.1 sulfurtransferase TusA family protein [Euryarchaeota archaeon]MBT3757317.1 sulfurtransferase TusA family protein [Euryarchaeota archaeon]MBT4050138.1 sulfurtransferase TusA family protein [Euryarchaeota archaeon]MBT4346871.1 sulfurtransferase TusA family protein [Euryarchaeota archaeon]|tara:strand:- start:2974 stop:3204 length:231 start_codon:yes stop_codon:yes gene_type:complete
MTDYNEELDCSGLNCPLPILKTKKAVDKLESGQILKMVSTDPGSCNDVEAWSNRTKNQLLESGKEGDKYVFYIEKK